jgi:hypothetical protein
MGAVTLGAEGSHHIASHTGCDGVIALEDIVADHIPRAHNAEPGR